MSMHLDHRRVMLKSCFTIVLQSESSRKLSPMGLITGIGKSRKTPSNHELGPMKYDDSACIGQMMGKNNIEYPLTSFLRLLLTGGGERMSGGTRVVENDIRSMS